MPSVASSNPTFIKLRQTLAPSVSCGAAATRPHPRPRAAQLVHSPVAHTHRRAPETVLGLNVSLWAAAVEQRATRLELAASQVPACSPVAADLFAGTERLPGWDAGRAPAFGASSMDEWVMAVFHGRMGKGFLRWTSGQGLLLGSKGCDAVDLPVPSPRMGVLQRTLVPPDPPPSISASQ